MKTLSLLGLAVVASAVQLPLRPYLPGDSGAPEFLSSSQPLESTNAAQKSFVSAENDATRASATSERGGTAGAYEMHRHVSFPDHRIRLRRPQLCDSEVLQCSGYLDVDEDKHFFFWYASGSEYEARVQRMVVASPHRGCRQILRESYQTRRITSCTLVEW